MKFRNLAAKLGQLRRLWRTFFLIHIYIIEAAKWVFIYENEALRLIYWIFEWWIWIIGITDPFANEDSVCTGTRVFRQIFQNKLLCNAFLCDSIHFSNPLLSRSGQLNDFFFTLVMVYFFNVLQTLNVSHFDMIQFHFHAFFIFFTFFVAVADHLITFSQERLTFFTEEIAGKQQ